MRFLTSDTLGSKLAGKTVLAPAVRELFSLNLVYVVAALLLVPIVVHALVATVRRERYGASIQKGKNTWRWTGVAIKSSLMLIILALLAGMTDVASLLLLTAVATSVFVCGLAVEAYDVYKPASSRVAAVLGVAAAAVALLGVGLYLLASAVFGSASVPGYLWLLFGLTAAWFASMIANTHLVNSKVGKWANYIYGEVWHLALSFVATTVFVWVVFIAVLKP